MCPRGAKLLADEGGLLETAAIVAHCLLVEAGGELVLIDTGLGLADCADPGRIALPFRAAIRPTFNSDETAARQLERLGLDRRDVRHIITTHLDGDHAGGLGDFPGAEVHVFAPELEAALHPSLRERARYVEQHWAHGPNWVEHTVEGESWFGFESVRLLPDLDAEIALVPLPGHSAGMSGVAINIGDGWLLHCGDAFFHHGEIETPRRCPPGLRLFQTITESDRKARHENQERLRELRRDHGDEVTLICSHDAKMLEDAQRATSPAPGAGLS
ncbi:MAG TPA: MBL fold metallo-hydrolase [Solirubrobacterales bacterium]|nr:MBL fold metallo-hydrolase [Solirubrobacterales bacterium]